MFSRISTIIGVICAALVIIFSSMIWETNTFGNYQVKQAAATGEISVRNAPGVYLQMFGDIFPYPISEDIDFEDYNTMVRFNDGSSAKVRGTVKFKLSLNEDKQKELHRDYGSFENVKQDLIRRNVSEALSQAATLMTAEDSYSTRRAEFSDMAKQQVEKGIFKTETKTTDDIDVDGTKFKKRIISVSRDSNGNPIVQKKSLLEHYGIEILQFVVNDFEYDNKVEENISKRKETEQLKLVSAANAEKSKQDAITAEAQGQARIAEAKANAEVKKITEVIEGEKKAAVAELAAKQAKFEAEKIKAEGEAKAFAARKLVEAGLTPLEKATLDKETKVEVAKALAGVKFPERMVIAGSGANGGTNPFDAVGLQALYDLSNKMGTNKE